MSTINIIDVVEKTIGGQWTGVKFHGPGDAPEGTRVAGVTGVCEAVAKSFRESIVLPSECIACCGARRSLALEDGDEELVRKIAGDCGIGQALASRAVKETPRLATPPAALSLGRLVDPDVVVGYIRPEAAMRLVRRWQYVHGGGPLVRLSSFMAICGDVLVGAHVSNRLRLSFGCRDSREYGGVDDDRLVVGVPRVLVSFLFEEMAEHANV
jgi:uncharacterized protein (DUF169 family)